MRLSIVLAASLMCGTAATAEDIKPADVVFADGAVAQSLTGQPGNPENGAVLMDKGAGNCIACHQVDALPALDFQGTVGPQLDGVADRWDEAQLRGIVSNAKQMFPETVMPSFYKTSGYIRPGDAFTSKPIAPEAITPLLTAAEVEDVVAYLMTLKN